MRIIGSILIACSLCWLGLVGCGDSSREATPGNETAPIRIQGLGASFPAPLYQTWFKTYSDQHPGTILDYQSVGSGSGVKAVIDGTANFGASDAAMTLAEMAKVERGVQLVPLTAGSVVLAYNLEGVKELRLPRDVYPAIFLGTITRWNDPRILAANPLAELPDAPIHVVVRADSSGTTFVFTKHLSTISEEFAEAPGENKMPSWPTGTRAKGNEGVTASIKTTPGAIGYVEYGYAMSQELSTALLQNKSGKFVRASTASGQAALSSAEFSDDMIAWVPDPQAPGAYPIVTYTWLILYRTYREPRELEVLKDVVRYAISEGQKLAEPLGYIPLPSSVRQRVQAALLDIHVEHETK